MGGVTSHRATPRVMVPFIKSVRGCGKDELALLTTNEGMSHRASIDSSSYSMREGSSSNIKVSSDGNTLGPRVISGPNDLLGPLLGLT
ncbi:hypothetical protein HAX54_047410, partial [Datura stramonium]|nr:hypothetical protein [Datura stramonium]